MNVTNTAAASLSDDEKAEILDWVSACQSAYHIDSTPGHRFSELGSNLEDNRAELIACIDEIVSRRATTTPNADAAPSEAKRGTDAQILFERKLTCEAINGAMAFGYQNTNPPPSDEHWLAPFWNLGRMQAEGEAAIAAGGAQEAIYQVMVGEKWVDSTAAEYAAVSNEKRIVYASPLPRVAATVALTNLEGLRARLLAPRVIARDKDGWLWHPDYPVCDEGTRADKLLEAFGIETAFVGMESDAPDLAERWHEEGLTDCSEWTPTPPGGDGWLLLEIYDTEDGPYALFGRDHYAAEQARKKEHTRRLSEAVRRARLERAAASNGEQ